VSRGNSLAVALGVVGVVFLVVAALYALGVLQIATSSSSGPHYKHAILFVVLAAASFVGANFARPKMAS
jgi:hypothetical protein